MTRVFEMEPHDSGTVETKANVIDEEIHHDHVFSYHELARIDEALTMSSRETGLRFTLYIGDLGKQTRIRAEEMHGGSGNNPAESVLIAVSPGQRVVEVVTGAAAARRIPDRACALAVLSMTTTFANGDLVGGIVGGLRQLSDQAGHPAWRRTF